MATAKRQESLARFKANAPITLGKKDKALRQKPPAPKESWWTKFAAPESSREAFQQAVARLEGERLRGDGFVEPWTPRKR